MTGGPSPPPPPFTCHMSCVMCHMSRLKGPRKEKKNEKVVKVVIGGSDINGARLQTGGFCLVAELAQGGLLLTGLLCLVHM